VLCYGWGEAGGVKVVVISIGFCRIRGGSNGGKMGGLEWLGGLMLLGWRACRRRLVLNWINYFF
jgi:hypothetical protein